MDVVWGALGAGAGGGCVSWGGAGRLVGPRAGRIAVGRFSPQVGHPRIYSLVLAGGAAKAISLPFLAVQGLAFSRDGRRLSFIAGTNPPNTTDIAGADALYVSMADGLRVPRLMGGGVLVAAPAWSPDGKRIGFVRPAPKGNY